MTKEEPYDVVVSALEEKKEKLWKMTKKNMEHSSFNIMDTIRLEQIERLESAILCWKTHRSEYLDDGT